MKKSSKPHNKTTKKTNKPNKSSIQDNTPINNKAILTTQKDNTTQGIQAQSDIDTINHKLDVLSDKINHAFNVGDFGTVKKLISEQVLQLAPNQPVALQHLAIAEMSLGNNDGAYRAAILALQYAQDDNLISLYSTLINITTKLNHFEESRYYARLLLAHHKNLVAHISPNELPKRKRKGLHSQKNKNIISFSLFGDMPRYCETAVLNAALAADIYPKWTCRFYVDSTVPSHVVERLEQHNAQIVVMDKHSTIPKSLWRLLVISDADVHCFMIRNADTLISYKEKFAIDAWLDSKKYFHIMRDSLSHTQPLLAGMWAGYTDAFDDINALACDFFSQTPATLQTTQSFINQKIYPTVAQNALVHDSHHLDDDSLPYPNYTLSDIEKTPHFHIGMVDALARTATIYLPEAYQAITWHLLNQAEQVICYYNSPVVQTSDNRFVAILNLPYIYNQNIHNGNWKLVYQPTEITS